jgi:hypothetical protein
MLVRLITRISQQRKASLYPHVAICRQVLACGTIERMRVVIF